MHIIFNEVELQVLSAKIGLGAKRLTAGSHAPHLVGAEVATHGVRVCHEGHTGCVMKGTLLLLQQFVYMG